ncbi:MAG: sugar ABC transporter substrate-binding protein [Burkholderiaceae bacterium]|nr:sugar ABC transporter substrate-binding protein [Burkholderiaceae bacterium]
MNIHDSRTSVGASIYLARGVLSLLVAVFLSMGALCGPAFAATEITYWTFIDPKLDNPRSRNLAESIARFEKNNPDIKVKVQVLPWHQVAAQVVQATAAGRTPDVARILGWDLPTLVAAGSLAPLNEFTDKWPKEVRADFMIDWDATVWNGQKLAIPYELRIPLLWYRADLLKEVGKGVPRTIDELVDAGKALNARKNTQGMVIGLSRASQASAFAEWLMVMLHYYGGEVLDSKGEPKFNGEAGVKVVKLLKRLVDEGVMPRSVVGYTYEEVFQGVVAGTIGMNVLGSHRVVTAREAGKYGSRLQTAPIPGETADKPAPAYVFGWNLVVGKHSKNKEAAWKFVEHMTNPESQVATARMTGELPTRISPYGNEFFKGDKAAEVQGWREYIQKHGFAPRYPEKYVEITQLIVDAVQEAIVRNVDPKEALDRAAARMKALR